MSYSFWCSKCKIDHAGECAIEYKHEWEPQPMTQLCHTYFCWTCSQLYVKSYEDLINGTAKDPPVTGCVKPGSLQHHKRKRVIYLDNI